MNRNQSHANFAFGFGLILFVIAPAIADELIPPGGSGSGRIVLGEGSGTTYFTTADLSGWNLNPMVDVNTHTSVIHVKSDSNWQLSVKDLDLVNTKGHLTEWDGSSYITSNRLTSPISVSVQAGGNVSIGYEVALPDGGIIASGTGTGNTGKDVVVTFRQPVSWSDKPLPSGHSFHMTIVFGISSSK